MQITCILCHQPADLLTLDGEGWGGMPAHTDCAAPMRSELARFLTEVEADIRAEKDPRRHRASAR